MSECLETDVLILGCGVAGGTVALCLADAGMPVTLVTRAADPNDTNTNWAQGGIIYQGKEDSPALLVEDILRAGAGHASRQAATILATEGPGLVEDILLKRLGVDATAVLVDVTVDDNVERAVRNLPGVSCVKSRDLTARAVLRAARVVATRDALEQLQAALA